MSGVGVEFVPIKFVVCQTCPALVRAKPWRVPRFRLVLVTTIVDLARAISQALA